MHYEIILVHTVLYNEYVYMYMYLPHRCTHTLYMYVHMY